jgi:methyl-accepting chemotaxis protein
MNTQIATAAEQQSQVAQEIDQRVTHVSGMAERTRNEGRSVVQACVQIDAETSRLSQALERFRT